MDVELRRLIREHYPFPIAHAHKKTLAFLDDDAHKSDTPGKAGGLMSRAASKAVDLAP